MKRFFALIIAVVMLASFAACSGGKVDPKPTDEPKTTDAPNTTDKPADPTDAPVDPTDAPAANVTPADVEAAIKAALGEGYLCEVDVPEEELFSTVLIELDMNKVENYIAKLALVSSVDLDQISIVSCSEGYADEAARIMAENHQRTLDYIAQYPFGVAKVQGTRLYKVDNMVIYILAGASYDGENAEEEAALAAAEYQKIDDAVAALFGSLPENLLG